MPTLNVLTWLQENMQRLLTKSPLFFKIWQIVWGSIAFITGLPQFINYLSGNGIHIPMMFDGPLNEMVGVASTVGLFMSLLVTQSTPKSINKDGNILKVTNGEKLPFTHAAEVKTLKKIEKKEENIELEKAKSDMSYQEWLENKQKHI